MRQAWTRMSSLFEVAAHPEGLFACRVRRSTGHGSAPSRTASAGGGAVATAADAAAGVDAAAAAPAVDAAALDAEQQQGKLAGEQEVTNEAGRVAEENQEEADEAEQGEWAPDQETRLSTASASARASADDPFALLAVSERVTVESVAESVAEAPDCTVTSSQDEAPAAPSPLVAPPAARALAAAASLGVPGTPVAGAAASRAELSAVVASHASMRGEVEALSEQVRASSTHSSRQQRGAAGSVETRVTTKRVRVLVVAQQACWCFPCGQSLYAPCRVHAEGRVHDHQSASNHTTLPQVGALTEALRAVQEDAVRAAQPVAEAPPAGPTVDVGAAAAEALRGAIASCEARLASLEQAASAAAPTTAAAAQQRGSSAGVSRQSSLGLLGRQLSGLEASLAPEAVEELRAAMERLEGQVGPSGGGGMGGLLA
jgi:hypothetical protein